jgi:hypothetical protein
MDITHALLSLRPGAKWQINGSDYSRLEWLDSVQSKPTMAQVNAEIARLQKQYDDTEYQRLRAEEYPPVTDYLDAVVKGDLAQQQAYIDACLAVKAKYPKPEGA